MDIARIIAAVAADRTPLIRTDFTDDAAWRAVVAEVSKPVDFDDPENPSPGEDGYDPNIAAIEDPSFEGATGTGLGAAFTAVGESGGYVLLADSRSMAEAVGDLTVDVVDLSVTDPEDADLFDSFMGRTFRCAASEIASIEANLSIANMDFGEFADGVGADGVFRGF